jgi:hypothetical protein
MSLFCVGHHLETLISQCTKIGDVLEHTSFFTHARPLIQNRVRLGATGEFGSARSSVAIHSIWESSATSNDFHFTGKMWLRAVATPAFCASVRG